MEVLLFENVQESKPVNTVESIAEVMPKEFCKLAKTYLSYDIILMLRFLRKPLCPIGMYLSSVGDIPARIDSISRIELRRVMGRVLW